MQECDKCSMETDSAQECFDCSITTCEDCGDFEDGEWLCVNCLERPD